MLLHAFISCTYMQTHGAFPAEDLLLAVQKYDDVAWLVKQLVLRSNAFWRRHDELEQLRKMYVLVTASLWCPDT